ncbi:hypothetical protein GCM10025778_31220 [Paeniglutamicibacter antarcticus]|uniref:Uncharacterized protein n=1 Tax=Paeniglutamicibacter antarcticus TaxID=494023 RepID=A0ABP9TPA7_9MICC
MGRPVATVRRWLRRAAAPTHTLWLYEQAVQQAFRLNPEILVRPKSWPSMLGWSPNVLAATH